MDILYKLIYGRLLEHAINNKIHRKKAHEIIAEVYHIPKPYRREIFKKLIEEKYMIKENNIWYKFLK